MYNIIIANVCTAMATYDKASQTSVMTNYYCLCLCGQYIGQLCPGE